MRKPSTTFKWVDMSGTTTNTQPLEVRPLFLQPASFDKGPEEFRSVYGDDFYKLYGQSISYKKHGQAAIQAANIIDNGGEVLVKRVVADDATLANAIVLAHVSQGQAAKVDSAGNPVYIDSETGQETSEATGADGLPNERAMINTAIIKYDSSYVTDAKTLADVEAQQKALLVEKDADVIEGLPDQAEWVIYEGTLTNGAQAPMKTVVDTEDPDEEGSGATHQEPYPEGTIIQDSEMTIFRVVNGNVLKRLGSGKSEYTYPFMAVVDNGRGVSSKRFNITPNYQLSKGVGFGIYELNYLGTVNYDYETVRFSCDPDVIYADKSMSLTMAAKDLVQMKASMDENVEDKFLAKVAEFSGIAIDELKLLDVYFGCDRRGDAIPEVTIDPEGFLLNAEYGILLQGGDNGAFGDAPIESPEYSKKLIEVFDGTFDDIIFNPDRFMIEACVDANYPLEVKEAIAALVTAREDFFFFRDIGIGNNSYDAVVLADADFTYKNKFIADYCQYYDVIDPFTKKQITVTIGYSLARILVNHLDVYRNAPVSGILYDCVIPEAIEGTVGFIPKVTPTVDQEQMLVDNHINYAAYISNTLTLMTQYTSQVQETQCSHINNILTVQETIRDIRKMCPRIRGSFIDRSDSLEKYAKQIQDIIDKHVEEYEKIVLTWTADDVLINNKVFNAALEVTFKNFVIAEVFTIYTTDAIAASI